MSLNFPNSPSINDEFVVGSKIWVYDGTKWNLKQIATTATNISTDITNFNGVLSAADSTVQLALDTIDNIVSLDNIDYIDFDTTANHAVLEGEIAWDDGEGTFVLGLKGGNVNLQVGQENIALCYNGTGSTLTDGTVVYISGAQGQRPRISKAQANSEAASSKTLGIVTEPIANGAEGFVTTFGIVNGVDTSAFVAGDALWLSPTVAGGLTKTKPTAPDHLVFVGYAVSINASSGRIFVNPQNGYELDELHDVLITTPSDGQVLTYDSATSIWKNENPSGGAGVTVSDTAPVSASQGDMWFNSSNAKTYVYYDSSWVEIGGGNGNVAVSTDVSLSNSWWLGV